MDELRCTLTEQKISPDEFAALIGVHGETVRRYLRGARLPSKAEMVRIYVATGGRVRPDHFYDLPPLAEAA